MENISRRKFLKNSAITVAVTSTSLCNLGGCSAITKVGSTPSINSESFTVKDNAITIDLQKNPILSKVGGSGKIIHPAIPQSMIIAHVEENRYEIASLLCPHRNVEVEYEHDQGNFECSSIGSSTFSLDGKNLSGPADKPLREYDAEINNGILVIKI